MITNNDWDAAAEAFMEEERERLGGPPSPEEVIAYQRGELSPDQSERIQALLVYYPDLTSLLLEDEPERSEHELARERKSARHRPITWWQAAAAVFLAATLGLMVQLVRVQRELSSPFVLRQQHVLEPLVATRGAAPPANALPPGEKQYRLVLEPADAREFPGYRIDLVTNRHTVWSSQVERQADGVFELSIRRSLLDDDTYRIDLYGVDGARTELLNQYLVRVAGE